MTYLHDALKRPDSDIRIYCDCLIDKIIHKSTDGGVLVVEGLEGAFVNPDGRNAYRIRVNAKLVIISAGAIASSKILLKNGIAQKTAEWGN